MGRQTIINQFLGSLVRSMCGGIADAGGGTNSCEDNIMLVLISMDRGGQKIAAPFYRNAGLPPISLYDPKAEMGRAIGLRGLPTCW